MGVKLLIVGGVAGGASAAARARRMDEDAEIILFEKDGHVSFANCGLPYYIGGEIESREKLFVTTPGELKARFNIDVRVMSEVLEIDREHKKVRVKNSTTGEQYWEAYDRLVLATGSAPVKLPVPGIHLSSLFTLRNVPDSDRIDTYIKEKKPAHAVIIGGGFIGLEMAENLQRRGLEVTVVEFLDQVMAPVDFEMAAIVHRHMREKGVTLRLKEGVTALAEREGRTIVSTSAGSEIACDMVLMAAGVKPESALAENAGLELGVRGSIRVDESMRTSDPDIFAVGDAVEVIDFVTGRPASVPLAGPANRQGRIAADNALGGKSVYRGTQGTAIARVFDLTAAVTGSNEKTLRAGKIPYLVCHTFSASHATYYPDATRIYVKILFEPAGGKLLGAQIIGRDGVDKRIDVLATALRASMTVYDLEDLELAYAPPFSSAKDPVNMAGFVAVNMLKGHIKTVNWDEIAAVDRERTTLVDLRDESEREMSGVIRGALHIPLNSLRGRIGELDRSREYIFFCASGLRSYIGCRIASQKGIKCRNLSGGYTFFHPAVSEGMDQKLIERIAARTS